MKKSLLVALAILAITLGASAPSAAQGRGRHGFSGGHFSGPHHFHGHHPFHGRGPVFVGVGPSFFWGPPWWYSPAYVAPVVVAPPPLYVQPPPPPAYWYYCPSYGAYYPYVRNCPELWVPVPATP